MARSDLWSGSLLFATLLTAAACGGSSTLDGGAGSGGQSGSGGSSATGGTSAGGAGGSGGQAGTPSGLPCDVAEVIGNNCATCHATPPVGGAKVSLIALSDFTQPSSGDPKQTVGALAVKRMKDAAKPMPPGAQLPAADIATVESWVNAGMPGGSCTPGPGYVSTCTSGTTWKGGNQESPSMHPGKACIACHSADSEAPQFYFAGTVYQTAHEPADCNGGPPPGIETAQVEAMDANKAVFTVPVNSAGNFFYEGAQGPVAFPILVKVLYAGKTREMLTPVADGDCNACHTEAGANGAPGRIQLP